MAKQEGSAVEVEELRALKECPVFSGKSSDRKTLENNNESCEHFEEGDEYRAGKASPYQPIKGLEKNAVQLDGETKHEAQSLASVKCKAAGENKTPITPELSSDVVSSPVNSKILCDSCFRHLAENPALEDLKVSSPIKHLTEDSSLGFICKKHNKQPTKYCTECKKPLCELCVTEYKLHCKESETPEFADMSRSAIEKSIREMSDRESEAKRKLEAIDYESAEFLKKTETLQNDINRRRVELKELVDRHADSLLLEVDSWREEVSKIHGTEKEKLRRFLDSLGNYKTSCEDILVDGSVGDIQKVAADLGKKERELLRLPDAPFHGLLHSFRVSLKKTKPEEFLTAYYNTTTNIVGVLEDDSDYQEFEQIPEENKVSSTEDFPMSNTRMEKFIKVSEQRVIHGERVAYREDPVLVGTLRTKAAQKEDKGILGLAVLDDELFVVSRDSSEVEVFDCRRLIFSCELELNNLLNPEDISSCAKRKCLYIMDRKRNRSRSEILRVDKDGNLIKRWSTGGEWGRISVTPESNVLLCIYKTAKLNEYTSNGVLLRVIQFPSEAGLDHPRHAIKLTSGNFVVGHGEIGDSLHRVVKVDASGNVAVSFHGDSMASEDDLMKRPFYLAADEEGQCIFVADTDNRRVLLLSSALELKRELLSADQHGLRYPVRICIDISSGLLFVADNQGGDKHISVFLIK